MAISNNQIPVAAFLCYYPARDGRIGAIDEGLTDSEWVENIRVRVVPLGSLPLHQLPTPVEPYRDPQFAELIHVIDPSDRFSCPDDAARLLGR